MSGSQISDDREERNVLSEFLAKLSSLTEWAVVHSGVDRNHDIRLKGLDTVSDFFATKDGRMGVGPELIPLGVGKPIKQSPLSWMSRQVFVRRDKCSVR